MLKGLLLPLLLALTLYGCAGPAYRTVDPRTLPNLTIYGELYTQGFSSIDPGLELRVQIRRYTRDGDKLVADIPMRSTHVTTLMEFAITAAVPRDPATVDTLQVVALRQQQPEYATEPVTLALNRDPIQLGKLALQPADEVAFGRSYRCGELPLVYGSLGGQRQLLARGRLHRLEARDSSSAGQRYWSLEQSTTQLVDNGQRLLVALAGERLPECQLQQAMALPQSARGQNPDWYLHLSSQLLQFERLGTAQRLSAALLSEADGGDARRFVGAEQFVPITAWFKPQLCRDPRSPLPYPYQVNVALTDQHFEGCGGEPSDLLVGRHWQVNRLDELPPISRAPITFRFEADGRLSGYSACNRFNASWSIADNQLKIGPLVSTKMACRPRLATQEQLLFGLLENTQRFDIDAWGALHLEGSLGGIKAFSDPRQLR